MDADRAALAEENAALKAELAVARFEREQFCSAEEVLPMYLRRSDAEIMWDRKGA